MRRIYITVVLLLFTALAMAQKIHTDKEIGFDRQSIIKEINEDDLKWDSRQVESYLTTVRASLVEIYEIRQQNLKLARIPIANTACNNMNFQNNTSDWTFHWFNGTSGSVSDYNLRPSQNSGASSAVGNSTVNNIGGSRFQVVNANVFDPNLGQNINPNAASGERVLRLGRTEEIAGTVAGNAGQEEVSKTFTLSNNNAVLQYSYAIVFERPGHADIQNSFEVIIEVNGNPLGSCSGINYVFNSGNTSGNGFVPSSGNSNDRVKRWSTNIIDLLAFPGVSLGDDITISFRNRDCGYSAHASYAYVSSQCLSKEASIQETSPSGQLCVDEPVTFTSTAETLPNDSLVWNILLDGSIIATYSGNTASHSFDESGNYEVTFTITRGGCPFTYNKEIVIADCDCTECENCNSFQPLPGETYVVSAWVKEDHNVQKMTYVNARVRLAFFNDVGPLGIPLSFGPAGDIIDGWQRIKAEFIIPSGASGMTLDLVNNNANINAFFDDIRVHPFNSNMKSYVYDQKTQMLMAELDENNYATFFEYDKEGGLIRIKKETKNGVFTIQESRSGNVKSN